MRDSTGNPVCGELHAWREAGEGGCSEGLWLRLAAGREKDHPDDAARIYLKQAEAAIAAARPLSMNGFKVALTRTVVKRALLAAVGTRYWEQA